MSSTGTIDRLAGTHVVDGIAQRASRGLAVNGFPTSRDEAWHYTPLDEVLTRLHATVPAQQAKISRDVVDELVGSHATIRLVFVNGVYVPELSDHLQLEGVWCGTLADLPRHRRHTISALSTAAPMNGFDALNAASGSDHAVVMTDPNVQLAEPIHLAHLDVVTGAPQISHPRTLIAIGEHSNAELIESFTGTSSTRGTTFTNANTTIALACDSTLTHRRIQTEPLDTTHLGHTVVRQAARSRLVATSVMLGADIARHALDVELAGPETSTELDGVSVPCGHQRHDTSITVDHTSSHGHSTQRFMAVADDRARASFSGRIIVRPDTTANEAHQSSRNLLLCPTAQADTRPWLEILADDVSCTHGATVGRLDHEAMFYLRSRGIPADTARSMLIDAFISEVVEPIRPTSLRDHVVAAVETHRSGMRP